MTNERKAFILTNLVLSALLVSSCEIRDLRHDLDEISQDYGFFKGLASGADEGSSVLVGLFKSDEEGLALADFRIVRPGEPFYMPVQEANHAVLAFADLNGDLAYQPGEPAARLDDPIISWLRNMDPAGPIDYNAMQIQQIDLTSNTRLEEELDFSLDAIREVEAVSKNFLKTASWDDEQFSAENVKLGMWVPGAFLEEVGYGLYVLEEFDPTKNSIVLVHGIDDSPRVFKSLANVIPADYQLLLFHYPSAVSLEYTSYILTEVVAELVRRDQVPQFDIIAHSMGGLVSKGMIDKSDEAIRQRIRLFITIASPFGGVDAAASGLKWSPVVAPVWWAMAPHSSYLQRIDRLDLSMGPKHHLIFTFSHEAGGTSEGDDGVVTVRSQLAESAQRNATAIYGIADNHVGSVSNPCALTLLTAILEDGTTRATVPPCGEGNAASAKASSTSH